jgi:hypothetical protein
MTDTTTTTDTTQTTTTAADTTQTTTADTTQTTTPKWWEGDRFADPARQFLTAKGLTVDDPMEAMPKLADMAMTFEKRIGKGLDTIIDRPTKDEAWPDWVAKNREALGLPADEKGYAVKRPETWPKDAPWNQASEDKVRAVGVKYGLRPEAVQEIVDIAAADALTSYQDAQGLGEKAKADLMAELQRDHGDKTPALMLKARQGAEAVAQKAGIGADVLANLSDTLTDKIGDANVIRFMAAIGDMLGDDGILAAGKGGSLTQTPADARAELAQLRSPEGAYYKATATGNRAEIARLQPTIDRLTRIAAGG